MQQIATEIIDPRTIDKLLLLYDVSATSKSGISFLFDFPVWDKNLEMSFSGLELSTYVSYLLLSSLLSLV